jgi:DNA-binding MarR family transcriptional regulator
MRATRAELIARLSDELRAYSRAVDELDEVVCDTLQINRTDGRCLDLLDHHGSMTAGELARQSGLSTGAITTVIDRLAKRGYVRRVSDPDDRRKVLVEADPVIAHRACELYEGLMERGCEALPKLHVDDLEIVLRFVQVGCDLISNHAATLRARPDTARTGARQSTASGFTGPPVTPVIGTGATT